MGPDLTACDREPIHLSGAIQPHGLLIGLARDSFRVGAVSENVGPYFGAAPRDLLGAPAASLFDSAVFDAGRAASLAPGQSVRVARQDRLGNSAQAWHGVLHAQPDGWLLEAEFLPPGAASDALGLIEPFQEAILRVQQADNADSTWRSLSIEIQQFTGFSRVMLYRFAADWCGEVIAEASDGQMPSYAGLHFPASDIPVQARALYATQAQRQIPDVAYDAVPILQTDAAPLDLSPVGLRSVSPLHLAYLRNMGVGASMSISVLRGGKLWGLVACHHPCARWVSRERMQSCILLSQIAMARFGLIEEALVARHGGAVKALEARLLQEADDGDETAGALLRGDLLLRHSGALLGLVGASGMVLSAGGIATTLGDAPTGHKLQRLLQWVVAQGPETVATDHLARAYAAATEIAPAAGLLAVPLGGEAENCLVWLRPEIERRVTWAGDLAKSVQHVNGEDILTPRHSFAAWTEYVRGRALAWTATDIAAANSLRDTLAEIMARRAAQLHRANLRLRASNEELESFAYIASHDLKEPLRQIEVFGSLLQRAFGRQEAGTEKIERWLGGISTSSRRLRDLIDHLANYAKLGSEARAFEAADLGTMLSGVLDDFAGQIEAAQARVEVGFLPVMMCDDIMMRQVWQNLISNAIKYRSPARKPVLRIGAQPAPPGKEPYPIDLPAVTFHFEDNGIGFEPRHCDLIFKPFQRLHSAETYEGSGLGLAICRKVIERHGGTISATGVPGQGAIFTFTLPFRPLVAQPARAA